MWLGVVASQSWAQTADKSALPTLTEIVVTATRREENLEHVPASIVALSQSDMELTGAKSIDDITALVPGVEFDRDTFGGQISFISFRGIYAVAGESTTGVYIDDTAIQGRINPNGFSFFGNPYPVTFDLNRVEFERGPQGTLFGAGAEGGAVRFIFNQPNLKEFTGEARAEIADTQGGALSYEYGLALGGPIVPDMLGFRASAYYRTDGGYINRIDPFNSQVVQSNSNGVETKAFRLAFTGAIGEAVTVTPSVVYQSTQTHDQSVFTAYLSNSSNGDFNSGQLLAQPSSDTFYLPALDIEADLGFGKLSSVTSYFSRTANTLVDVTRLFGLISGGYGNPLGPEFPASYADAALEPSGTSQDVFTQEIRLASPDSLSRLKWVVGLFYSHARQDEVSNTYSRVISAENGVPPSQPLLYVATNTIDTQSAAFGQVEYVIAGGLKATVGLRVEHMKTDYTDLAGGIFNAGVLPVASGGESENPVTPKFALSYQADTDNLYYIDVAKGYRVGGANSPLPSYCGTTDPITYASDQVWAYEAGAKNRLLGNRLQIDASVFHVDWRNIQQDIFLPCGFGFLANSKNASSDGFDVAIEALVTQRLKIDVSVAYTNAKLRNDVSYAGSLIVQKGDAIGAVPEVISPWNVTLSGQYDIALPGSIKGYLRAEDLFRSRNPGPFATDIPNTIGYAPAFVPNPSTNVVNMRVGAIKGRTEVSLFLQNVLNSQPLLFKNVDYQGSAIVDYSTFRPRTFGLNVDYHF
jgi:outer membrane receptor protein involved in Fe transport